MLQKNSQRLETIVLFPRFQTFIFEDLYYVPLAFPITNKVLCSYPIALSNTPLIPGLCTTPL
jgi:hypothetical protein